MLPHPDIGKRRVNTSQLVRSFMENNGNRTWRVREQRKMEKDFTIATWIIQSMVRPVVLKVINELNKYNIKITALQEVRWKGHRMMASGNRIEF